RESGVNGGRGGSAYMSDPVSGFIGENSIVGAGLPIAAGVALAAQIQRADYVVAVSFGDGATNQGASHEGFLFAVSKSLPVLFICENNRWSEMTPIDQMVPVELRARAASYGMRATVVDGNDPQAVAEAVAEAATDARGGKGPVFLECLTERLGAHYQADIQHYRPKEDVERARAADPLPRLRARLLAEGEAEESLAALDADVAATLEAAERVALAGERAHSSTLAFVYREDPHGKPTPIDAAAPELTYSAAINQALQRELRERPEAILYGEDVAVPGGNFGITRKLLDVAGERRVFDTPISEAAILGSAVGAAMEGMRPIVEIMFGDFFLVALDQLVNQAANVSYLSRGQVPGSLVVRTQQAVTPGSCAQHVQCLEALLAHIPGLRVGLPASPQDAYAMTRAAVASADPVILYESRLLYQQKGPVVLDGPVEEIGGARLVREGDDLAIVTWGRYVVESTRAAEMLAADGISAAVLDLRWLNPLDEASIAAVVERASRVLVVHEANVTGGFGAEVIARIVSSSFEYLDAPPVRVGLPDVRMPAAPTLQTQVVPTSERIAAEAKMVLSR
ncbi:MAG: alpha-ketoacid dehydrogenase subunit alpha/beta, partial [Acidimicrobiales bacterium]